MWRLVSAGLSACRTRRSGTQVGKNGCGTCREPEIHNVLPKELRPAPGETPPVAALQGQSRNHLPLHPSWGTPPTEPPPGVQRAWSPAGAAHRRPSHVAGEGGGAAKGQGGGHGFRPVLPTHHLLLPKGCSHAGCPPPAWCPLFLSGHLKNVDDHLWTKEHFCVQSKRSGARLHERAQARGRLRGARLGGELPAPGVSGTAGRLAPPGLDTGHLDEILGHPSWVRASDMSVIRTPIGGHLGGGLTCMSPHFNVISFIPSFACYQTCNKDMCEHALTHSVLEQDRHVKHRLLLENVRLQATKNIGIPTNDSKSLWKVAEPVRVGGLSLSRL